EPIHHLTQHRHDELTSVFHGIWRDKSHGASVAFDPAPTAQIQPNRPPGATGFCGAPSPPMVHPVSGCTIGGDITKMPTTTMGPSPVYSSSSPPRRPLCGAASHVTKPSIRGAG